MIKGSNEVFIAGVRYVLQACSTRALAVHFAQEYTAELS